MFFSPFLSIFSSPPSLPLVPGKHRTVITPEVSGEERACERDRADEGTSKGGDQVDGICGFGVGHV